MGRHKNPLKAPDSNAVRVARVKARRLAEGVCVMKKEHGKPVRGGVCLACWAKRNRVTIEVAEQRIAALEAKERAELESEETAPQIAPHLGAVSGEGAS